MTALLSNPIAATYARSVSQNAEPGNEEAALAVRIRDASPARDLQAEERFCRRFAPRIRLFGLKRLRSEAAAADLVQDVLVLVLDKLRAGAVREPGQIASYVFGVARQLAIDTRRNTERRSRLVDTFALDLTPAEESSSPYEDVERLRDCLARLAERERAVLVMTFYDDCPADRLGSQLGISPGNVRVIRHRGLERLRACVQGKEPAP